MVLIIQVNVKLSSPTHCLALNQDGQGCGHEMLSILIVIKL